MDLTVSLTFDTCAQPFQVDAPAVSTSLNAKEFRKPGDGTELR